MFNKNCQKIERVTSITRDIIESGKIHTFKLQQYVGNEKNYVFREDGHYVFSDCILKVSNSYIIKVVKIDLAEGLSEMSEGAHPFEVKSVEEAGSLAEKEGGKKILCFMCDENGVVEDFYYSQATRNWDPSMAELANEWAYREMKRNGYLNV